MKQTKKLGLQREAIRQLAVSELHVADGTGVPASQLKNDEDTVTLTTR